MTSRNPGMKNSRALHIIKTIHTFIWAIMASATLHIFYAGITGIFNNLLLVSIALMVTEIVVLIFNAWSCPLTHIAKHYTAKRQPNFDIYLPRIIAKYNKEIFGTLFLTGLTLVLLNYFSRN